MQIEFTEITKNDLYDVKRGEGYIGILTNQRGEWKFVPTASNLYFSIKELHQIHNKLTELKLQGSK